MKSRSGLRRINSGVHRLHFCNGQASRGELRNLGAYCGRVPYGISGSAGAPSAAIYRFPKTIRHKDLLPPGIGESLQPLVLDHSDDFEPRRIRDINANALAECGLTGERLLGE